jgi:uncharacterized protein YbaP (TraB family)
MRRFLTALVMAWLGYAHAAETPAPACPSAPVKALAPEQIAAGYKAARDHGFLWRITRQGHSSYLYGTIHAAQMAWMFPGPALAQVLRVSDTLALEMDVLDADIMGRLVRGIRATSNPLPPALQQRLREHVRLACLPEQDTLGLIPEISVATLQAMAARRDGLEPAYGIDVVLSGWMHGGRKPVVSLETPELQIKALQMATPADTVSYVSESLDQLDTGLARQTLLRAAQAWADSDLDALAHYESWCDCMNTPRERADMARLLDDRNPAMAEAIAALHAGGHHVLAAVGSLHMVGPKGLPALLAQKGFVVEVLLPHQAAARP